MRREPVLFSRLNMNAFYRKEANRNTVYCLVSVLSVHLSIDFRARLSIYFCQSVCPSVCLFVFITFLSVHTYSSICLVHSSFCLSYRSRYICLYGTNERRSKNVSRGSFFTTQLFLLLLFLFFFFFSLFFVASQLLERASFL